MIHIPEATDSANWNPWVMKEKMPCSWEKSVGCGNGAGGRTWVEMIEIHLQNLKNKINLKGHLTNSTFASR